MKQVSPFPPKGQSWLWVLALLCLSAFIPLVMPPPGLTSHQPIGKFLNDSLPSLTPGNGGTDVTWSVEPVYPNLTFQDPLVITSHPTQNLVFVASRQGLIEYFVDDPATSTKDTLIDLTAETGVVWDGGFLGFALHPEFGQAGSPNRNYFYVYYTAKGPNGEHGPFSCSGTCFSCFGSANFFGSYLRLSRFEVTDGTLSASNSTEQQMFNIRQYNGTHRGGGLTFGNDDFLYLTIGDQARYAGAQNLVDNFEGGVIRIDVDQQGGAISHAPRRKMGVETGFGDEFTGVGYYVPNSNPWQDPSNGLFEEFVSVGHRAPHRMTLDKVTGDLWIGEVGQGSREEINRLQIGGNGGWPIYEGNLYQQMTACGSNNLAMGPGTYNAPVTDFLRTEARAIIGGYVYRGARFPSLYGKYLCGGYALNRLFVVESNGTKSELTTFTPGALITFGEDPNGEILMGRQAGNTTLYTLASSGGNPPAPQLLSQTGAFQDLITLTPTPGVIPYDMVQDFWSDGADKYRWISVPNDSDGHNTAAEQIQWSEEGNWDFPNGTVMIKHFELGGQRLETRFEVKGDDGTFYYLTYKWNAQQTDAELLTTGLDETVMVDGQPQVWHYPSQSECLTCHNETAGGVLGVKTRYLNREIVYPQTGLTANQLVTLSHIGILDQPISDTETANYLTIAAVDDTTASLEFRARSYLDLNCSYCHQPGTGNRAVFDARITTELANQNLIYGPLSDNLGVSGAWTIVPQDVPLSMIHSRMNALQASAAMPPLAKNVVDSAGVALMADWINSLPPSPPPSDLIVNGDASSSGGGCYELTPAQANQKGTAWYPNLVDLSKNVTFRFFLSLGSNNGGADGATFLLHNQGYGYAGGTGGGGLGAQGTTPSVGVEFDTWDNGSAEDMSDDHVAIWLNGNLTQPVVPAVCMDSTCADAEDGGARAIEIQWVADVQTLFVYVDGSLRTQYSESVVQSVFGGNQFVNAGLTAATGGAVNVQTVCGFEVEYPAAPPINLGIFTQTADIGDVAETGSASHVNGLYSLSGSGADIWNTADEFRYLYREHEGDGEIIARINSVSNTNTWAKGGVMFRESTDPGAKMVMLVQRPDNQLAFQWRMADNVNAAYIGALAGGTTPGKYVRLTRNGNAFAAYYSTISAAGPWTQIGGAQTIAMQEDVLVGLALTSHNDGTLCEAQFQEVSVIGGVPTPNLPPIAMAGDDQVLTDSDNSGTESVNLDGTSSTDPDGSITDYQWTLGGSIIASTAVAQVDLGVGTHSIVLTVTDDEGASASDTILVTIQAGVSSPPVVLYRVNAGGPFVASIDDGLDWEADTRFGPVIYLSSDPSGHRVSSVSASVYDPSVDQDQVPTTIFQRYRWDRNGGDDITYDFPVPSNADYGVRLHLIESAAGNGSGTRVFDVALEGNVPALGTDVDMSAEFGPLVAGMKEFVVSVQDGSLTLQLQRKLGNPQLCGIEIIENPNGSPPAGQPALQVSVDALALEAGTSSASQVFNVENTGTADLPNVTLNISGTDAAAYQVSPSSIDTLRVGTPVSVTVSLNSGTEGLYEASLDVDAVYPGISAQQVDLRGLRYGTAPSLQRLLDFVLGTGILSSGDDDPATTVIHSSPGTQSSALLGDEVDAQAFAPANPSIPVRVEVLAMYEPAAAITPSVRVGWQTWNDPTSQAELLTIDQADGSQTQSAGDGTFSPGTEPFTVYAQWANFADRIVYGIDSLNSFTGAVPHQVRVYALPGEANAYLLAMEAQTSALGYQDLVLIIRNATPATVVPPPPGGGTLTLQHRINAGGGNLAAIDGGIAWDADTRYGPSPFLVSDPTGHRVLSATMSSYDAAVDVSRVPTALFAKARWDRSGGDNIMYSFPLPSGTYEVHLYLAEPSASGGIGTRTFSISVEGSIPANLNSIDLASQFGPQVATMLSHRVVVNDGALDLEWQRLNGAPLLQGLELWSVMGGSARMAAPQAVAALADPEIVVFPNPISRHQKLRLRWTLPETEALTWRLFDGQGRLLQEGQLDPQTVRGERILPTHDLAAGVYLLQVNGTDWQRIRRVMLTD